MGMSYSVVGLGKLGASMAAAIASRGFNVIGVDINQRAVDLVNAGHAPVQETNLEAKLIAEKKVAFEKIVVIQANRSNAK